MSGMAWCPNSMFTRASHLDSSFVYIVAAERNLTNYQHRFTGNRLVPIHIGGNLENFAGLYRDMIDTTEYVQLHKQVVDANILSVYHSDIKNSSLTLRSRLH